MTSGSRASIPKIDRIACPWLIRRFINPEAEFIYVPPNEVLAVAEETGATPYDIQGVEFGHVGDRCSFDAIIRIYDIEDPALDHLAMIVRGADTSRPDLTPQCEGLLAISLWPVRESFRTTTRCWSTAWSSTTRSIAGAAVCRRRRTTGRPGSVKEAYAVAEISVAETNERRAAHGVSLREALRVWLRVALLSFGGPAGQIAVMHRILVEEKRWIRREPVPARAQLLHAAARARRRSSLRPISAG